MSQEMTLKAVTPSTINDTQDALILGLNKGGKPKDTWPDHDAILDTIEQVKFKGKAGETAWVLKPKETQAKSILLVGLGEKENDRDDLVKAAGSAIHALSKKCFTKAVMDFGLRDDDEKSAQAVGEGIVLANHHLQDYRTDPDAIRPTVKEVGVVGGHEEGLKIGHIVAEATNAAKDLVTRPANVVNPDYLAEFAKELGRKYGFEVTVLDEKGCEEKGMGAFLAVARGSTNPPRFIHMMWRPEGAKDHIGLVGKGLTFDTGGISIKPSSGMDEMKGDMGGAAAVLGTMMALGELRIPVAVDAVIASCENMPGGNAYRPGDIVKSMSGKTIEVLNTDAEGRVTLADALTFCQQQGTKTVIDLATLTGACVVALGPEYSATMSNDDALREEVLEAAKTGGELFWPLPLPPSYNDHIKSTLADVKNLSSIRWGGAITAGLFLQHFIEDDVKWVHLDIAGPSYCEKTSAINRNREGTGTGVRALIAFLRRRSGC